MAENNDISVKHKSIENASRVKNPFNDLKGYEYFVNGDFKVSLYCKAKDDMDEKTLKWAFKLAENNVSMHYKATSMGWQPKIKKSYLNKSWARYLIATNHLKQPIGYCMFRFDWDYGHSVLYCYEIHIEKSSQRKGLGKFMMSALEKCALHWDMEKIILTVLKTNPEGAEFFEKLGFKIDNTSPSVQENVDYEILSKVLQL